MNEHNFILFYFGLFAGPSSSGKTILLSKIMSNAGQLFDHAPVEIIYNYACWQEAYNEMQRLCPFPISFIEGVSTIDTLPNDGKHRLLCIDDQMENIAEDKNVADFFTKYSHHRNYSIIILTQNLFPKGKAFRTISLNVQYLFLLKSIRDIGSVRTLAQQMGESAFIMAAYQDAVKLPYSHLFINLKPSADENCRIRANIFDYPSMVYLKK